MSENVPSENFTDAGYARFEAAWLSRRDGAPPPSWQHYLPGPDEPCSCGLIVMLLKVDIECRVKAGLPGLLSERYFEHPRLQQPDARLDAEQQIELIRWEYEQRVQNGQPARCEEYEAAFPQHVDAIHQMTFLSRSPQSDPNITQQESGRNFLCPTWEGESTPLGMSPPSVAEDKSPALDLRDYELIDQLGQGGMGEVYRCCDPALSRDLAIKVIKSEFRNHAVVEQRFLREARITGSLQHPGIIAVHNLGRLADGRLFYTMRLLRDARTFDDILKEEAGNAERLPSLLMIFEKVCEAVAYAHSKRVIHRDLKPANIMVGKFGEVQVMDWGLAKLLTAEDEPSDEEPRLEVGGTLIHTEAQDTPSDLTQAGSGLGTPAYMPPEQAQGDWELVDERADVFALGAILCVMLTGQPPYCGRGVHELLRRARHGDLAEALTRLEQCGGDTALTDLCRECLSVEPQRRPRDAGVVARRVSDHQIAVEARLRQAELERTEAEVKSREERKRRRLAVMLSTAVLLVLVAGIVISSLFAIDARQQAGLARENEQKADDNAKLEKMARRSAEDQKTRAENEKTRADQKAEDARQQKQQAEAARDRAEWLLYVNQIPMAQREWQNGNLQHARDLLAACRWDFRGWEYAYLRHLCDDTQRTFRGHTGSVHSVCFSPDGKRLASGGTDQTVKVWDAATGQELLTLKGHSSGVRSVSFSPDGKHLASGSEDGTVKVRDAATGQEILTFKGHNREINSVCFSPDGKRLASGSSDGTVKVRDAVTGQELLTLKGHNFSVFSPDGKRLASLNISSVKVWDATTGQELLTFKGHNSRIDSVCFSPDGKRLASGSHDQTVKVWEVATGQEILTLKGHSSLVNSVCFSPDGERLASGSNDQTVKVWDAATGQEILTLKGHTGHILSVCFSADGKRLASGAWDHTTKIWDAATGQELLTLKGHSSGVRSVCFSPDGKRLASGSEDQTVKVWDASTGQELLTLKEHSNGVRSVSFSPDGKHLASGSDQTVKVWDASTGQELLTLKGHSHAVSSVCFSPDGKRLASGAWDMTVKVWDAATGQELLTLKGLIGSVFSVSFSPDGKRLASGGWGLTMNVWDATTEQDLDILKGHTSHFSSVGFSPDGNRIIAQSLADKTTGKPELRAWNAVSGAEIVPCTDPPPPPGQLRAVSPDSRMTLVVKGNTVEVRRRTPFTVNPEERRQVEVRRTLFWHQQQAQEAEQNRQWFAAAFHLDWLLHNGPEQAALLVRRGWVRSQQGRMDEASADIHRALQLEPKNLNALWWEARLCLASQDQPDYRRACAALQDALRGNSDWHWTIWLAHTSSLAPDALADWQPLLQRIEKTSEALPKKDWWTSCSLGWVLIRAGRYNEAIPHLQQLSTLRAKDFTIYDDLLLALAYHHLGKRDEALRYLGQAEKWWERGQAPVRASAAVGVGGASPLTLLSILHSEMADPRLASMPWEQRLELQLLYREVHQLLKSPPR